MGSAGVHFDNQQRYPFVYSKYLMAHTKKDRISILKPSGYHRVYFKHSVATETFQDTMAGGHFEIRNRCLWSDVIEAHRLDFYIIFLTTEGEGRHTLGLNEYAVSKNTLGFIGPDVISSWQSDSERQGGYFIAFSDEFYTGYNHNARLRELPFFKLDGQAVVKLSDSEIQFYLSLFQMMEAECKRREPHWSHVVRGLVHALLNKALSRYESRVTIPEKGTRGAALLTAFRELYMADMSSIRSGVPIPHRKIQDYASLLSVTPNHLTDTVKKLTGYSANQLIRNQLSKQASMCLLRSEKSVSEVAYLLGFEDSAYFARFYRAQTGQSPTEFRSEASEKYPILPVLS
jgi:AraC family transcriptional regulator, transcriptional activator of pobA